MPVVALASAKGSPGVTTLAVALAGLQPPPALLVDLDPAGGDLSLRFRDASGRPLDPDRGLLSLAAAVLRGPAPVADHLHVLGGGLGALVGLSSPEQATGLAPAWSGIVSLLASLPGTIIADCGRVTAFASAVPVLRSADVVLLVSRTDAGSLAHLRERVRTLADARGGRRGTTGPTAAAATGLGVVLIAASGERKAAADVQRLLDAGGLPARVLGAVADDPKGAGVLSGTGRGAPGRTDLVRSVRGMLPTLARFTDEVARRRPAVVG